MIPRHRSLRLQVLTFGILCLGWLNACNHEPEEAATASSPQDGAAIPAQQFFDYRLIESNAGIKQWVLQSAEMQKFTGQRDVILVEVHMDFFRDGEHFSVLTSDSGRTNLQTKNIHAWGDVVVVTDDGRRLETEDLFYDNETELIHNEVFNRFTRGADVMTGIGLEATPDLEYIELKEDVQAEVDDNSQTSASQPTRSDSEGGQH